MGMTPAVSLTAQSFEPDQAFAAAVSASATSITIGSVPVSINTTDNTGTVSVTYTGADLINSLEVKAGETTCSSTTDYSVAVTDGKTVQNVGTYTVTITGKAGSANITEDTAVVITVTVVGAATAVSAPQSPSNTARFTGTVDAQTYINGLLGSSLTITSAVPAADTDVTSYFDVIVSGVTANGAEQQDIALAITPKANANYVAPTQGTVLAVKVPAAPTIISELNNLVVKSGNTTLNYGGTTNITATAGQTGAQALQAFADAITTITGTTAAGTNVTLAKGTDFTVATNAATSEVIINGAGSYAGSISYKCALAYTFGTSNVTVTAPTDLVYNGKAKVPTFVVESPATGEEVKSGYSVTYQQVPATGSPVAITGAPINVGKYQAVVTLDGFEGTAVMSDSQFTITAAPFGNNNVEITEPADVTWTGDELAIPAVTAQYNFGTAQNKQLVPLVKDTDYTVTVETWDAEAETAGGTAIGTPTNPLEDPGTYVVVLTGKGNYANTKAYSAPFEVKAASISNASIEVVKPTDLLWSNGQSIPVELKVTLGGKTLTASTDGTNGDYKIVSPASGVITAPGSKTAITIQGLNNYTGTAQITVDVRQNINDCSAGISVPSAPVQYGATNSKTPTIQVKNGDDVLTEGVDYTVKYGTNSGAGKKAGTYTITGIGKWGGTYEGTYEIKGIAAQIKNVVKKPVTFNGQVQNPKDFITFDVYTADPATPNVFDVLVDPSEYSYTVSTSLEFKDATTYSYTINLGDCPYVVDSTNYGDITIQKANLANLTITPSQKTYLITDTKEGTQVPKPSYTVKLGDIEYELTSSDVTPAYSPALDENTSGQVTATLNSVATGNFTGSNTVKFEVYQNIANLFPVAIPAVTYNGQAQEPAVTLLADKDDTDTAVPRVVGTGTNAKINYTISYESNINAGTGKVIVTGTPKTANTGQVYAGTLEIPFTINKATGTLAVAAIADQTYTGSAITPEPAATLTANGATVASTYAYSYANNVNAGTATVTVVPMGVGANYDVAPATATFKINAADIKNATYTGDTNVTVGTQPKVSFTFNGKALVAGTDFKVTSTPIVDKAGKATLTVEGMGNFAGTKTIEITVGNKPVNPDKPSSTAGWKETSKGFWYDNGDNSYPTNTWKEIDGQWYHFNKWGYMETGWINDGGTWYYCNKWGHMTTGWQLVNGSWYYMNKWGKMQTGWQQIGGAWYYLNKWGAMAASQYVGPYWVDASGRWIQ